MLHQRGLSWIPDARAGTETILGVWNDLAVWGSEWAFSSQAVESPEAVFSENDVDGIVDILDTVRANAIPTDGAA